MNILIIGSGGREHALAWRMLKDPSVASLFVYPGNPGMAGTNRLHLIDEPLSLARAIEICGQNSITLVVIGPEKFLFEGWVDEFRAKEIAAFGPSQLASFLESSKGESKTFMREHGIKTAPFEIASTLEQAVQSIQAHPEWREGFVLKLSGPALGKGVIVTDTASEAIAAAEQFFHHRPAGIESGMIIEERIRGREVSLFYACNGERASFLGSACDHKRLLEGDQGPNTGGMGAYSPCHWIDQAFLEKTFQNLVKPTLQGLKLRGCAFSGVLFLGLMVREEESFLLEYNVRFGDPETQAILPLLGGDFTQLLMSASSPIRTESEKLPALPLLAQHSVHVVKAARGYPGLFGDKVESGMPISCNFSESAAVTWFFAGVIQKDQNLLTHGGRICGVTAVADNHSSAKRLAYDSVQEVHFEGEQYRRDIGGIA